MAWTTDELVTASDIHSIGENPAAVGGATAHITKNSGAFVDINRKNLTLTITIRGGDALAHFQGSVRYTDGDRSATVYFDVDIDSSRQGGNDGIMENKMDRRYHNVSFTRLIQNLSAGYHAFKLQWKRGGGTITLKAHVQFWVIETGAADNMLDTGLA